MRASGIRRFLHLRENRVNGFSTSFFIKHNIKFESFIFRVLKQDLAKMKIAMCFYLIAILIFSTKHFCSLLNESQINALLNDMPF